jgi:non-heme Fe2+,alpha-ketoglutarate-dependent halogenase
MTLSPSSAAGEQFARDGYLCPINVFEPEETDALRAHFDKLEADTGQANSVIGLKDRHFDQRFIWEVATDPRLLDWIECIAGPDLLLMSTHFFCKYPGGDDGHFVAWHQDVTYWGLEPARAVTAWVAIDDSSKRNGCMEVIPASHTQGIITHSQSGRANNLLASNQAIVSTQIDSNSAVPFELRAGQMSLHDGALAHGSLPNQSTQRRCGLTLRFITPDIRQEKANNGGAWWQPVLVRGNDAYEHFEATTLPYPLTAAASESTGPAAAV